MYHEILSELVAGAVIVCDLENERGHFKCSAGSMERVSRKEIEQLDTNGYVEKEDNASVRVWKASKKAILQRQVPLGSKQ